MVAAVAWTVLIAGFVIFYPSDHVTLPCMRLVGRTLACERDQATINAAFQTYQTLPVLVAMAAGYVAIAAVLIKASRGSTRRR